MRKRRVYMRDFKLSVLRELQTKNAAEVCREHGINPSLIPKWRKEYRENPKRAFSGKGNLWKKDAELERYKRLLGESYAEIDFLKKTAARLQELIAEEERMRSLR